eukprot:3286879-Rhodomonas_salina.3
MASILWVKAEATILSVDKKHGECLDLKNTCCTSFKSLHKSVRTRRPSSTRVPGSTRAMSACGRTVNVGRASLSSEVISMMREQPYSQFYAFWNCFDRGS